MLLKKIKIYAFTLVFLFASPSNKILPQVSVQALHIARSNPYTFVNADNTHLIYQDEIPVYKNPKYSVDERVEDLLSRMSLEEKIGQMNMPALFVKDLGESIEEKMEACKLFARGTYEEGIGPGGGFYCIPDKMLHNGPRQQAEYLNKLQRIAREETRLDIPLFMIEEGTHVLRASGATIFPEGLAIGSTWNMDIAICRCPHCMNLVMA